VTPELALERLAAPLPPATLVMGAGAWHVVLQAADLRWSVWTDLSADDARRIRAEAVMMPTVRGQRVIVLRLDGATAVVQDMLLKVLEDPPPSTRFVLSCETRPQATVFSRCRLLVVGDPFEEPAPGYGTEEKTQVVAAIRAAIAGPGPQLTAACKGWLPAHLAALADWAGEVVTDTWAEFTPGAVPCTQDQALRLLAELSAREPAKLAPQVALERVFSARQ
jgi:DNA polymerase III, delta subunit